MPNTKNHGGKRKGAGKPALYGEPMKRINIILDPETVEFYKQHGKSLSEGIRNYWRGITMRAADLPKPCPVCGCGHNGFHDKQKHDAYAASR